MEALFYILRKTSKEVQEPKHDIIFETLNTEKTFYTQ